MTLTAVNAFTSFLVEIKLAIFKRMHFLYFSAAALRNKNIMTVKKVERALQSVFSHVMPN